MLKEWDLLLTPSSLKITERQSGLPHQWINSVGILNTDEQIKNVCRINQRHWLIVQSVQRVERLEDVEKITCAFLRKEETQDGLEYVGR